MSVLGIILCFLMAYICTGSLLAIITLLSMYYAKKYYPERVQKILEEVFFSKFTREEFSKANFKLFGIIPVTEKNLFLCCCFEVAGALFLKWPKVILRRGRR